jgi:tRNA U38,U39,U40 pseudouridine synthase TruA
MARSIAGTLLAVGRGEVVDLTISQALATGQRELAGETARAKGLTLMEVVYDSRLCNRPESSRE